MWWTLPTRPVLRWFDWEGEGEGEVDLVWKEWIVVKVDLLGLGEGSQMDVWVCLA